MIILMAIWNNIVKKLCPKIIYLINIIENSKYNKKNIFQVIKLLKKMKNKLYKKFIVKF
jgi:hypothetical protein